MPTSITEISGTIHLSDGTATGFTILADPAGEPQVEYTSTGTSLVAGVDVVDLILGATRSRFGVKP